MKFDYLIIGAGTAGCVLANRLSENPQNDVAIFEAGGNSDIWKVNMPLALLYTMHDPKYNFKYYSEPEPHLNNRRLFCPRGKMIGGCSAHNGMVYVRGNKEDYRRWASFGLKDWDYEKVLPYFKKIETWSGGENEYRGGDGILPINQSQNNNPLFKAFLASAEEAGHKINKDMNGEDQEGFGMYDVTIHKGERASASKYYLNPARKKSNLKVFTQSFVEKIIFEGTKAIGIEVNIKGKINKIFANKEIILSGGSINSPQLLMLSGVGPASHIKEKGIEVIKNIPGVGRNLQDHLETYIQQECNTSDTLYKYINKFNMIKAGIQWFLNKSGPCSTSFLEAGGFCKSSPDKEYPNIQFHFFPSFVIDHGKVDPDAHGYQLHASLNQPKSRGNIELNTSNPYDHPKIQFNYLEDEYDLNETVKCIHVAREILKQNSMKPYAGKEIGPGDHAQNEEEIKEYIRSKAETAYHPSCTLKMGVDDMAVVNEKLKVNGLQNLRVADASVMPEITSGNLNAPTLMIAERAADFILN
ncbi:choline dehydrogenase [Candidatus Pelagibacter sp.]|jgi:choline dehydrogenase|nr:choline dehydrogenase [Candidatus Pelagibacter sp.]